MDEPHPLYILLCRHSINARLCLLFGLIFVSVKFAVLPVQNMDQGIFFWGILIAAACSPALCFPYIAAIWIKITPITDRVTYYEEEFIFLLSVFIGTSFFLYLAFPIHPMEGLRLGGGLTAILAPFSVLVWALKSIVAPLSKRNLSAQVESAQQYRDTTPNFLRNILACCAAGLATAVTNLLLLLILFESQGQPLFGHVPFISAYGFLFMSILTAPLLVFFGRLLIS